MSNITNIKVQKIINAFSDAGDCSVVMEALKHFPLPNLIEMQHMITSILSDLLIENDHTCEHHNA